MNCDKASALFRSNQPPVEIKTSGMLIAAQIYQPNLLITEFHGPLTIADPGKAPTIVANWKLAQSSVRGTPAAPERVSLVFDGRWSTASTAARARTCCTPSTSKSTAASSKARSPTIR